MHFEQISVLQVYGDAGTWLIFLVAFSVFSFLDLVELESVLKKKSCLTHKLGAQIVHFFSGIIIIIIIIISLSLPGIIFK